MKTRTKLLLSLGAASVALAGCAAVHEMMGGGGGGKPAMGGRIDCNSGICNVTVAVNNCVITDPGSLHVKQRGPVKILWKAPSGYDFTSNGISFKDNGPFDCAGGNQGHGAFACIDTNSGPGGPYHYRIEVKKDGATSACPALDPDVVNE